MSEEYPQLNQSSNIQVENLVDSELQPQAERRSSMSLSIFLISLCSAIAQSAISLFIVSISSCSGEFCIIPIATFLVSFLTTAVFLIISHWVSLIFDKSIRPVIFYFVITFLSAALLLSGASSMLDAGNGIDLESFVFSELLLFTGMAYIFFFIKKNSSTIFGRKIFLIPLVLLLAFQLFAYFSPAGNILFRHGQTQEETAKVVAEKQLDQKLEQINIDQNASSLPSSCTMGKVSSTISYKITAIKCDLNQTINSVDGELSLHWAGEVAIGMPGEDLYPRTKGAFTDAAITPGTMLVNGVSANTRVMVTRDGAYFLEISWNGPTYKYKMIADFESTNGEFWGYDVAADFKLQDFSANIAAIITR